MAENIEKMKEELEEKIEVEKEKLENVTGGLKQVLSDAKVTPGGLYGNNQKP